MTKISIRFLMTGKFVLFGMTTIPNGGSLPLILSEYLARAQMQETTGMS
jgi:hypothetical protein